MICDACGTDFEGDAGDLCPVCAPTQQDLDQLVELFGISIQIGPAGSAGSSPPGVADTLGPPLSRSRNDLDAADTGAPEAAAAGPLSCFTAAVENIRRRMLEAAHELAPISMIAQAAVGSADELEVAAATEMAETARALCVEAAELLRSLSPPRNDLRDSAPSPTGVREEGGVPRAAIAGSLRGA